MQFLVLLEANIGAYAARGFNVLELNLLDALRARSCLFRFRGVGREAAHKLLEVGDLCRFFRIDRLQTLARGGGCDHEVIVVAGVNPQLTVVDIRHVCANRIEEVTIVRDDNHRRAALVEHLFEPANGVDVEVVGWFVE